MGCQESSIPEKCLACDAPLTSPIVCQGCRTLYPVPQSVDYFSLLGVDRVYDVDPELLNERFVSISRHIHPDYFTSAGDQMRQLSVRLAADVNDAVKVLKDPVLRAAYMLELAGGPSGADNRTVPPDVLDEAMMLRERIESAQRAGDEPALASVREEVQARRDQLVETIAELARQLPKANEQVQTRLREAINSIKYYDNALTLVWR